MTSRLKARTMSKRSPSKLPPDLAASAGIKDVSVQKRTGLTWAEWVRELDALGAPDKTHKEIAAMVGERWPEIGGWWAQSVTVGYERIRGLRAVGQERRTKTFSASRSRTYPVAPDRLYRAFATKRGRAKWLEIDLSVRSSKRGEVVRFDGPEGTRIDVQVVAKGAEKATVTVAERGLPDAGARDAAKRAWGERLDTLGRCLRA